MRAFIAIFALVVIAAIGWFYLGGQDAEPVAGETAQPAAEAAEDTADAAEGVAEETGAALEEAIDATSDAIENAAEAASDAMNEADAALEGAIDATNQALQDTTDAASATTDAAATADADAALSVERFDADQVRAVIEASDLDPLRKETALGLVDSAEQNPDMVQTVVERLKADFGL